MPNALRIVQQFYPNVTKVVDAPKKLNVTLTKRDVENAKRKDHTGCAVAEACHRELGVGAIVSTRTAYLVRGDTAVRYAVPQRMFREITSFDRGAGMELGEYDLNQPFARPVGTPARKTGKGHTPGVSHTTHRHAEGIRETLADTLPPSKGKRRRK